ncbi:MAG TPA: signal peptidase II [Syntrophales bacterium]|nr:signal peptidase II [Syntrophales bacterium]
MNKYGVFAIPAAGILALDQLTKYWIDSSMAIHDTITVLSGFFSITYVRNPGAAFGFLADASPMFRYAFFAAVNVVAIVLILSYIRKAGEKESRMILGLSLIMSGAVGNLIDRIRFGEVVDFLDFYIGSVHWPAFNVADSSITVGAFFLIWELWKRGKESRRLSNPT